ncbi:MAG: pyrroline-5-carboxylate reductase [Bacilli bacterium]
MLENKKVCFVGAGAMAEAVLAGMLNKRLIKPGAVSVTNRSDRFRLDELVYNFGVIADADQKQKSISEADILILAMKPKDVRSAIMEIKGLTHSKQLILSVVAGIPTQLISTLLGHEAPIIRTMPNTSAMIGYSATGMCQGVTATEEHVALAKHIFESIGIVEIVEEDQLDAVTGLSGSGPAYIYLLVEAMKIGAIEAGLSESVSTQLIQQTLIGAAHMLSETGQEPSALREKVTSPNGTTEAGIEVLRKYRFEQGIIDCIVRATERSRELGEEFK